MNRKKLILAVAGILLLSGFLVAAGQVHATKKSEAAEPYLLVFNAPWCGPCLRMNSLMERLEKEEGVKLERYGIQTSTGNAKFQDWNKRVKSPCPSIPFFVNTRTLNTVCGTTDYEHLRSWALEKAKK